MAQHVEYLSAHYPELSWDKALRKVSSDERQAAKWLLTKVIVLSSSKLACGYHQHMPSCEYLRLTYAFTQDCTADAYGWHCLHRVCVAKAQRGVPLQLMICQLFCTP